MNEFMRDWSPAIVVALRDNGDPAAFVKHVEDVLSEIRLADQPSLEDRFLLASLELLRRDLLDAIEEEAEA